VMAGMAKRGTHSARHRAGRSKPDAGRPDVPQSEVRRPDLTDPGSAGLSEPSSGLPAPGQYGPDPGQYGPDPGQYGPDPRQYGPGPAWPDPAGPSAFAPPARFDAQAAFNSPSGTFPSGPGAGAGLPVPDWTMPDLAARGPTAGPWPLAGDPGPLAGDPGPLAGPAPGSLAGPGVGPVAGTESFAGSGPGAGLFADPGSGIPASLAGPGAPLRYQARPASEVLGDQPFAPLPDGALRSPERLAPLPPGPVGPALPLAPPDSGPNGAGLAGTKLK